MYACVCVCVIVTVGVVVNNIIVHCNNQNFQQLISTNNTATHNNTHTNSTNAIFNSTDNDR